MDREVLFLHNQLAVRFMCRASGSVVTPDPGCPPAISGLANLSNQIEFVMNNPGNMRTSRRIPLAGILTVAATLLMAGCGGGGGGSPTRHHGESPVPQYREPDAGRAIGLTGSARPTESAADQGARAPGILARLDSIIPSTVFGRTDSPLLPTVQASAGCSGSTCSVSVSTVEFSYGIDLQTITASTDEVGAVLTRNGVTTLYYGDEGEEYDTRLYAPGCSMGHSSSARWRGSFPPESP